jgi:cyclopropane fatty-acyl-phospholipid synthase-like methyltransferase
MPFNPGDNPREIVQRGYDQCALAYAAARATEPPAALVQLAARLPAGAAVLDIGCGCGMPVASWLAERFEVTGVDISAAQVQLARVHAPRIRIVHGDVMAMDLPPRSFDAIVSFYTIFHLPREEHAGLFARCRAWLRPGGWLLATLTRDADPPYVEPFHGTQMYWSNWSFDHYLRLLADAGFAVMEQTQAGHGYSDPAAEEVHPIVLCRAEGL